MNYSNFLKNIDKIEPGDRVQIHYKSKLASDNGVTITKENKEDILRAIGDMNDKIKSIVVYKKWGE